MKLLGRKVLVLPLRVVIADDSESYCAALRQLLKTIPGISVVAEARNGEDTLETMRQVSPDLLILDIHLPTMSGWNVLKELRASGNPACVLIHTAYGGEHFHEKARQNGAAAYVAKGNVQLLVDTLIQLKQGCGGEASAPRG
jgi:DNA-binding NarL/FixJ family response regulator